MNLTLTRSRKVKGIYRNQLLALGRQRRILEQSELRPAFPQGRVVDSKMEVYHVIQ